MTDDDNSSRVSIIASIPEWCLQGLPLARRCLLHTGTAGPSNANDLECALPSCIQVQRPNEAGEKNATCSFEMLTGAVSKGAAVYRAWLVSDFVCFPYKDADHVTFIK